MRDKQTESDHVERVHWALCSEYDQTSARRCLLVPDLRTADEPSTELRSRLSGALHSGLFFRFVCQVDREASNVSYTEKDTLIWLKKQKYVALLMLYFSNIKIQNKISKMVNCLEYFTTHQWTWSDTNVQSLHAILGAHDRHIFQLDVNKIDWETFVESYVLGFREFLFKQAPDSLPSTRRRMSKLVCAQTRRL